MFVGTLRDPKGPTRVIIHFGRKSSQNCKYNCIRMSALLKILREKDTNEKEHTYCSLADKYTAQTEEIREWKK